MLPREILCEIFKWCEHRDLARWMRVCKRFNRAIRRMVNSIKLDDPYLSFQTGMYLVVDRALDEEPSLHKALALACESGHPGIVRKVTSRMGQVTISPPLIERLCKKRNTRMICLLIECAAHCTTDLIYAAIKVQTFDIATIIIREADKHGRHINWNLVLEYASKYSNADFVKRVVRIMVKLGIHIDWNSRLKDACIYERIDIIEFIEQEAKLIAPDYKLDWDAICKLARDYGLINIGIIAKNNGGKPPAPE